MREVVGVQNTERISIICEIVLSLQAKEGSSLGGREKKLLFLTWRARENMGIVRLYLCAARCCRNSHSKKVS